METAFRKPKGCLQADNKRLPKPLQLLPWERYGAFNKRFPMKILLIVTLFINQINFLSGQTRYIGTIKEYQKFDNSSFFQIETGDTIIMTKSNGSFDFTLKENKKIKELKIKGLHYYTLSIVDIPQSNYVYFDTIQMLTYSNIQDGHNRDRKILGIKIGKKWEISGDIPNPIVKHKKAELIYLNHKITYNLIEKFHLKTAYSNLTKLKN